MTAYYSIDGRPRSIAIWMEEREDGFMGPPKRFHVYERNPPGGSTIYLLELEQFDPATSTAVYRVGPPGGQEGHR